MDQWQRCAATKERSSSLSSFWGTVGVVPTLYFGVLSFAFVGIGTLIHITAPKSSLSPDLVRVAAGEVVAFGNTLYGPFIAAVLCAILIWGLICAAMSTIDTYIMSASHSIFPDFLARNRGTLAEQSHSDGDLAALQTARRVTGVVPLIVICMAIIFGIASDVYAFVYFSFSFMFAILPPLIVSLCGVAHRYPPRTAVVSLAVGALFAILGYSLVLIPALEFGLRSNRPELVFWSYQGIYWWPILTALVGGSVFLVRGKSLPEDKPSLIHF
jgi:Na+/pantothenate symporter